MSIHRTVYGHCTCGNVCPSTLASKLRATEESPYGTAIALDILKGFF